MRTTKTTGRLLLLLSFLLAYAASGMAYDFAYEGINYTVISGTSFCKTKEGYYPEYSAKPVSGSNVSGVIVLPEKVYDSKNRKYYDLKEIGKLSFYNCDELQEVVIPSSVTSLGEYAFEQCKSLIKIDMSCNLETIGGYTFSGCDSLVDIQIPESVTEIGSCAFQSCYDLESVQIPSGVSKLAFGIFWNCRSLKSVELPYGLKTIGSSVFWGCSALESLVIPETVSGNIGDSAFYNCSSLSELEFEGAVSIEKDVFSGCKLNALLFRSDVNVNEDSFKDMQAGSLILCRRADLDKIASIAKVETGSWDNPYELNLTPYIAGVGVDALLNQYYKGGDDYVATVEFKEYSNDQSIPVSELPTIIYQNFPSFSIWSPQYITLVWRNSHGEVEHRYEFLNLNPQLQMDYTAACTSVTINKVNCLTDITFEPFLYDAIFNDGYGNVTHNDFVDGITISNLEVGKEYEVTLRAIFRDDFYYDSERLYVQTKPVLISGEISNAGPTMAVLSGSYDAGDAKVLRAWWSGANQICEEPVVTLTGLSPETTYTVKYTVEVEGGKQFSKDVTFTTSKLELDMLDPKCVSESKAIVAAKTNISDEEMNVGFQWKKYDAPASLKPSEGYAAVYDGVLEGCIKNLQSTSYYNVRAFYKDSEEKYYYSDWVTFDPSDFSYFEPTVHTYPAQRPGSNEVTLKGYVLAGTDDVESQGFEYWVTDAPQKVRAYSPAGQEVFTAMGTGQVMTVVLTDLKPDTTYGYRAFVKTASGVMYGEEHSFTTESDTSGVESVENPDADEKFVLGYYDMSGRRYDVPQRGFNIIVYSDGTTRKMMHK